MLSFYIIDPHKKGGYYDYSNMNIIMPWQERQNVCSSLRTPKGRDL